MDTGRTNHPLNGAVKGLGRVNITIIVLGLSLIAFLLILMLIGMLQFIFQCVLSIGSGCDM